MSSGIRCRLQKEKEKRKTSVSELRSQFNFLRDNISEAINAPKSNPNVIFFHDPSSSSLQSQPEQPKVRKQRTSKVHPIKIYEYKANHL